MRCAMADYSDSRVREIFASHFECVGRGLYRLRFNRRSENPTEWIPVDFFSKVRVGSARPCVEFLPPTLTAPPLASAAPTPRARRWTRPS
jgi:hypothetical protein